MKKKIRKKLSLSRETLRSLEDEASLKGAVGGTDSEGTRCRTDCGSCPPSACHPSECPDTCCC